MISTLYLRELDNAIALFKCHHSRDYNEIVYAYLGIKSKSIRLLLNSFFWAFKIALVLFAAIYITVVFLAMLCNVKKNKMVKPVTDSELYLFYLPLFYGRLKTAGLFDQSNTWLVGGIINKSKYNLEHKNVVKTLNFIKRKDLIAAYKCSFKTIEKYFFEYSCYYPIYKSWEYYLNYSVLSSMTKGKTIYFSNQSDRWALMFDNLPATHKILVQHGIASDTVICPARLSHIDELYCISKQTLPNFLLSILNCNPKIHFMKPTIQLTDMGGH